jgi:hypothetical protein
MRTPTAFICNKSHHDFRAVREWGVPVFLTEGWRDMYDVGTMWRLIKPKLDISYPEDFIVQTSLPILFSLATGIMVARHGVVHMLLFSKGIYIERTVSFLEYETSDWRK